MTKAERISTLMRRLWTNKKWVRKEKRRRASLEYRHALSDGLKLAYKNGTKKPVKHSKLTKSRMAAKVKDRWNDKDWSMNELRRRRSQTSRRRASLAAKEAWKLRDRKQASLAQRRAAPKKLKTLTKDPIKFQKWRENLSKGQVKRWRSKLSRRQQSKKLKNAWEDDRKGTSLRLGLSKILKRWNTRMTSLEKKVYLILKELNYSYKFTGGGRGRVGRYVPDFMHTRRLKIIEVYGAHWHGDIVSSAKDRRRINEIRRLGYAVLVIRQRELNDPETVKMKIRQFNNS